jgi:plasmid stability protein
MATIQIRDIPDDVYEIIRRRAKAGGQSIQAYMLAELTAAARRRSKQEALAETREAMAAENSPGSTMDSVLDALQDGRR